MLRDTTYFEEHRRVGKALLQAFGKSASGLEAQLRCDLEGFVFAWAALSTCSDLATGNPRAALNATILAPLMFTYSIDAARRAVWRQVKREEQRKKQEEETAKAEAAEARQASSPTAEAVAGRSLVVARLSESEMKNPKLKEILGPFKGLVNEALPLIEAPPLHEVRKKLLFEFPYAADVVDFALSDLVGHATSCVNTPLSITTAITLQVMPSLPRAAISREQSTDHTPLDRASRCPNT